MLCITFLENTHVYGFRANEMFFWKMNLIALVVKMMGGLRVASAALSSAVTVGLTWKQWTALEAQMLL